MAASCSFEDTNGAISWNRLEALLSSQQSGHGCRRIVFDVVQRLKSKRYETVLNTFTVMDFLPNSLNTPVLPGIATFTVGRTHAQLVQKHRNSVKIIASVITALRLELRYVWPAVASHLQRERFSRGAEALGKRSHLQCLHRDSERQEQHTCCWACAAASRLETHVQARLFLCVGTAVLVSIHWGTCK